MAAKRNGQENLNGLRRVNNAMQAILEHFGCDQQVSRLLKSIFAESFGDYPCESRVGVGSSLEDQRASRVMVDGMDDPETARGRFVAGLRLGKHFVVVHEVTDGR